MDTAGRRIGESAWELDVRLPRIGGMTATLLTSHILTMPRSDEIEQTRDALRDEARTKLGVTGDERH